MIGAPNHFAHDHKSAATYLDVAANDHGDEKGLLVHRALRRIESTEPHMVEIGPGGGAAVDYLATQAVEKGADDCDRTWDSWLTREGRETYADLTVDELLSAFAVHSINAHPGRDFVLMPVSAEDVFTRNRHYYNRFLAHRLSNPLVDAKQMVLFQNIPLSDTDTLHRALGILQAICSKPTLARLHTAIHWKG